MSTFKYNRLDKNDAAVLLVDHQSGLTNLVHDFSPDDFKNNVLALADAAKYFKLPTILTTSFENGPNGPLVPELKETFPAAPYIARPGNINAWDNPDFVATVKATGKKQLIIAGIVTEVCVAFPALSAREEGYEVVLVNSNPATIMTDPATADRTYIEPLTWEIVAKVIEKERPDALLPTLGGQTGLNVAMDLWRHDVLEKYGVEMIGANADVIDGLDRDQVGCCAARQAE